VGISIHYKFSVELNASYPVVTIPYQRLPANQNSRKSNTSEVANQKPEVMWFKELREVLEHFSKCEKVPPGSLMREIPQSGATIRE